MKILITNHHLLDYAGSEIYMLNLAKGLKRFGHDIIVYSKFIDKLKNDFDVRKIKYTSNLSSIQDEPFDIAHVHHNISAYEVRYYFPKLPILFLSHGSTPFLEKPPIIDLNIQQYGAVSKIVRDMLMTYKISPKNIKIMPNIVDETLFRPDGPISSKPKTALLLSSRIDEKREQAIRDACEKMGIQLKAIGLRFGWVPNKDLPKIINQSDIVFTIGRGVIETMMCGRIPFIYDIHGGCGILTPKIFYKSLDYSFSGRYLEKNYSASEIVKEINKKYSNSLASNLQSLTLTNFSINNNVPRIIKIYEHVIKKYRLKVINFFQLEHIVNIISNSISYEYSFAARNIKQYEQNIRQNIILDNRNLKMKIEVLEKNMDTITSSKTYKIWQWFNNIKYKLSILVSFITMIVYIDTKWIYFLFIFFLLVIYIISEMTIF